MGRTHLLLIFVLLLLASGAARAQGIGVAWTKVPSVIIVGPAGDARGPLVHAAVAHWNSVLAPIGSPFRPGACHETPGRQLSRAGQDRGRVVGRRVRFTR